MRQREKNQQDSSLVDWKSDGESRHLPQKHGSGACTPASAEFKASAVDLAETARTVVQVAVEFFGRIGIQFFDKQLNPNVSDNGAGLTFKDVQRRDKRSVWQVLIPLSLAQACTEPEHVHTFLCKVFFSVQNQSFVVRKSMTKTP